MAEESKKSVLGKRKKNSDAADEDGETNGEEAPVKKKRAKRPNRNPEALLARFLERIWKAVHDNPKVR